MTASTDDTWLRLESSRSSPTWGEVGRIGRRGSLTDEFERAMRDLGPQLVRLRSVWVAHVPPSFRPARAVAELQPPEVENVGLEFRQGAPDEWAPLEAELAKDPDYRAAAAVLDEVGRARDSAHELLRAASGEREVPAGFCLHQKGGRKALDPFVRLSRGIFLVDEEFTAALSGEGLVDGWSTAAVPVFDHRGDRVETHRLLVVTGRVSQNGLRTELVAGATDGSAADPGEGSEGPALAGLLRRPGGLATNVVASPAAATVLEAARLPGLELTDELWS
jgi:hypothetical protein